MINARVNPRWWCEQESCKCDKIEIIDSAAGLGAPGLTSCGDLGVIYSAPSTSQKKGELPDSSEASVAETWAPCAIQLSTYATVTVGLLTGLELQIVMDGYRQK